MGPGSELEAAGDMEWEMELELELEAWVAANAGSGRGSTAADVSRAWFRSHSDHAWSAA